MDGYKLEQMQRKALCSATSELFHEKELKAWSHLSGLQKLDGQIDTITDSEVKNAGREVDLQGKGPF